MPPSIANRARRLFRLALLGLALFAVAASPAAARTPAPIPIRVVIVTTWEETRPPRGEFGELSAWLSRWPMTTQIPFPLGERSLAYDPKRHVLAILTGMATARASASIMALGTDPRFDLSHAYWIVAGTAGVDPKIASVGSAAWAHFVVDGDLAQELDARDMPSDWSTGILPYDRAIPFGEPAPPPLTDDGHFAYALNPRLADWAYARTRDIPLKDTPNLAALRAPYAAGGFAEGGRTPFVLQADGLMSARTWYGARMNDWARLWVPYWTGGKGVFAMSAEEDTGIMQALTFLARAGKARTDRVLILRAASDYTLAPPGVAAADFVAQEVKSGFPATPEALDSLYAVAAPVARALADDWVHTRDQTPGSARALTLGRCTREWRFNHS